MSGAALWRDLFFLGTGLVLDHFHPQEQIPRPTREDSFLRNTGHIVELHLELQFAGHRQLSRGAFPEIVAAHDDRNAEPGTHTLTPHR
jgi:hypothetical protein